MRILDTNPIQVIPEKGMLLTNGETVSTVVDEPIILGVNDHPNNWRDITVEEAERLQSPIEEEVI